MLTVNMYEYCHNEVERISRDYNELWRDMEEKFFPTLSRNVLRTAETKILETFIAYSNIQREIEKVSSSSKWKWRKKIYILKISFLCEEKKAGTV